MKENNIEFEFGKKNVSVNSIQRKNIKEIVYRRWSLIVGNIIRAKKKGMGVKMNENRIEPTDEIVKLLFVNPLNTLAEVQKIISNKK